VWEEYTLFFTALGEGWHEFELAGALTRDVALLFGKTADSFWEGCSRA